MTGVVKKLPNTQSSNATRTEQVFRNFLRLPDSFACSPTKSSDMKSLSSVKPVIFLAFLHVALSQRVAPGVPPNQYQPPPQQVPQYQQQQVPNQQYQQPQHGQHGGPPPNVQHQQPPPQHHQQPPPQHHQAPPQGHHQPHGQHAQHGQHGQPPQVLNPGNIQEERDHIKEHLEVPIDTSKMSEQELQFHYFKMHDSDNNNKLDGCELIKSLIHWHEQGSKEHREGQPQVEEKLFSDEELVALIDPILQMDDLSRDGYIDYPEFIKAQQKAASHQQRP
ncbi:general transcriptional corepressor trfA-like isoform X2 [Phlebotomus argentipes]|uniref:general transcriptional corepressor trfA-like isoform X2 n=1 Tax=Phlebotomus argentipes TaxID=94469 RepID=UPI0028931410|nr:general transcriptional corepressor trfA-like isoform X2 [Phlebotomus argentipes]